MVASLAARICARIRNALYNITIEPAMFLIAFASNTDNVAVSQMNIYKACRVDLGYNATVCDNLIPDYPEANEAVQEQIAQFNVFRLIQDSLFSVFFSFYLGAWADMFGRKLLFYIFLSARILSQVGVILCAHFLVSPKEWILLATLPAALSGGYAAFVLALNSFVSDITKPERRAFRFGMIHLSSCLGRPLAAPFGAYLFKTGGYVCVMTTSLVGVILASVILIIRIKQYKWQPEATRIKKRNAFSLLHVKDCFQATFKRRQGPNRKYILILLAIDVIAQMPAYGEFSVAYNYVRTRYGWEVEEYSTYLSITSASSLLGQAIFIPLMAMLSINESWIMTLIFLSTTTRHLVKAFATESWMYYLGAFLDIVGSYAFAVVTSMTSTCVQAEELGKVYAVQSAFENLLPISITQGYASLWSLTDSSIPGAVFFLSAGLSVIALSLSVYVLISLKGRKIAELTKPKTSEETGEHRITSRTSSL